MQRVVLPPIARQMKRSIHRKFVSEDHLDRLTPVAVEQTAGKASAISTVPFFADVDRGKWLT